ncbi:MAG: maleylpyruvate isomerase family mycothiol-dependent enzyme [Acidimicrobiales bacterium]|jgi:uncharacterized protein (TIGR03083 family)|nr:maleylpyruvate isomerase family mycothiol-dependent enzyme [Acidimicrobiales bacterium]MDP6298556.1 maleylpyruvate isomerase family mycothiol-dependent enzyme [Acidimicrobiales bacterium]HJM29135.1 maleylpyruvate isomerase family mycothiol-dependent enzyme [Acidimicrobiales bacterium]HJM97451.1 maleylpyruvate isomerase family mycothiol-dependent enzyme [Acidimicrobiales bacterium]
MSNRKNMMQALENCFTEFEFLISNLTNNDWQTQSLCPNWNVKGVVTHLAGIENLLLGWIPKNADEWPPFPKMAEFEKVADGLSSAELLDRSLSIVNERRQELNEIGDEKWGLECMTPVGPGTYGRFMNIRIFDFWVHQRDMAIPLNIETIDSGVHAEIALDEVHGSLGYIAGKKIGLEDGMSIAFHLSGSLEKDLFAVVDGRASVADHVDNPTIEINVDSKSFVMLACGRVDPQVEIDAGRISWSGNDEWGERAARNLRFTM